jgi:hypothetical protein
MVNANTLVKAGEAFAGIWKRNSLPLDFRRYVQKNYDIV